MFLHCWMRVPDHPIIETKKKSNSNHYVFRALQFRCGNQNLFSIGFVWWVHVEFWFFFLCSSLSCSFCASCFININFSECFLSTAGIWFVPVHFKWNFSKKKKKIFSWLQSFLLCFMLVIELLKYRYEPVLSGLVWILFNCCAFLTKWIKSYLNYFWITHKCRRIWIFGIGHNRSHRFIANFPLCFI